LARLLEEDERRCFGPTGRSPSSRRTATKRAGNRLSSGQDRLDEFSDAFPQRGPRTEPGDVSIIREYCVHSATHPGFNGEQPSASRQHVSTRCADCTSASGIVQRFARSRLPFDKIGGSGHDRPCRRHDPHLRRIRRGGAAVRRSRNAGGGGGGGLKPADVPENAGSLPQVRSTPPTCIRLIRGVHAQDASFPKGEQTVRNVKTPSPAGRRLKRIDVVRGAPWSSLWRVNEGHEPLRGYEAE